MRLTFAALVLTAVACAAAPAPVDWRDVAVLERNREGEAHLALPTSLPGCEHLGMTRVSIPQGVPGLPPEILDTLRKKAARMGGDALVLLPGRRVVANTLRRSVFRCGPEAPAANRWRREPAEAEWVVVDEEAARSAASGRV
ncbi:MAG TPA: hypothetical protein VGC93_17525 [Thermoanaerobaculia bacterium]